MSDNVQIDITTIQDNINIDYSYPAGPQGPAGVNEWGTILGTLSTQTDLWRYLSAGGGTSNFDIATLNNYLSTTPVVLSSLNVKGQILSAGIPLHNIFLTSESGYTFLEATTSIDTIFGGNSATGNFSAVLQGELNNVTGDYSVILGGVQNVLTHDSSFIIGTNLVSDATNYTYVNNLKSQNNVAAANAAIDNTLTVPNIELIDTIVGQGQEMIISDGNVNTGHGFNTLTLNFDQGVYIGKSNNPTNMTVFGTLTAYNISTSNLNFNSLDLAGSLTTQGNVSSNAVVYASGGNSNIWNNTTTNLSTLSSQAVIKSTFYSTSSILLSTVGSYIITIPKNYKYVKFIAIGGGGGGGGGGALNSVTISKRGGGGGSSGYYQNITYAIASLSAQGAPFALSAVVGQGGLGGSGAVASSTPPGNDGVDGSAGEPTQVVLIGNSRTIVYAPGGRRGTRGKMTTTAANGQGGGGVAEVGDATSVLAVGGLAIGGDAQSSSFGRSGQDNMYGAGGGGAGGNITTSNSTFYSGGNGGLGSRSLGNSLTTTAGTSSVGSTAVTPAQLFFDQLVCGNGGGGGGADINTGYNGGNGILGGGGGGGSGANAGNAGSGGNGGNGALLIHLYN